MHAAMGTGRLVAGRYRLLGPVGRGAMGIVWRGRDELLDRDVAVKQVQISALSMPAEAEVAYQRTLREARTAARLSHPSVVTVFDVVEEDASPWIIMELISGRSLDQVIAEDGPLPPLLAAELGSCLLGALSTAHAAGVLHRDVKPSNVLIAADGRTVLTDFGIATFAEDPALTQVGMIVGTPGFTAPERVKGGSASPASDLWSLGATLYAAVEGRGPFNRPGGSIAISAGVAREEAPRAPSAGPLAPVIEALLRREPAERPDAAATATLLADAAAAGDAELAGGLAGLGTEVLAGGAGLGGAGLGPAGLGAAGLGAAGLGAAGLSAPGLAGAGDGAGAARGDGDAAGATGAADGGAVDGTGAGAAGSAGPAGRAVAADFLAPPDYAELSMPAPADGLTGDPGGPLPVRLTGAVADAATGTRRVLAGSGYQGPTAGLPEFMDPPGGSAGGAPGQAGPPGPGLLASDGRRRRAWSRTWRIGTACAAVAAIVIAAVIGFRVYSNSLIGGTPRSLAVVGTPGPAPTISGHAGRTRHSASAGQPGGASQPTAPRPSHGASSAPAGGGQPSHSPAPSGSPSGGTSSSPPAGGGGSGGGSGGGNGTPPAGFSWRSVTGASMGTTAGFLIAAPTAWTMRTAGTSAYLDPPAGRTEVTISLAPFSYPRPVREARYEQATTRQAGQYPGYRLGAIRPTDFMGVTAAIWRFSWKPAGQTGRTAVWSELVTLQTSAGAQPYEMTLSVPAARFQAGRHTFERMLSTFQPQP
jgi:tRNA A-37 threonylcarbamoyl transferase component Bud32